MDEILFSPAELRSFAVAALEASGTPGDLAAAVARSLVRADLTGHESHGIARLPSYLRGVRVGRIQP